MTEVHLEGKSQFISDFDPHICLSKLDSTDVGAMDVCLLGEVLLGKSSRLSFLSDGGAEGSS